MMHWNNWIIWMRWQPRINSNTDESPEMSWALRKDKLARGKWARKTLEPRKRIWSTWKLELGPPEKKKKMRNVHWDKNSPVETIDERLKRLHMNENWCSKETQAPGRRGWEGGKNKGNLKGEPTNMLKRKHRLKESKGFAWVGWILDYGLRFREEEGWAGGKRKQLRIELGKDEEARVDLMRNAPDKKSWGTTIEKPTTWS